MKGPNNIAQHNYDLTVKRQTNVLNDELHHIV